MKFSNVIGEIDPRLLEKAEEVLTDVLFELSLNHEFQEGLTTLGGDPFFYYMLSNIKHVATEFIPTAATDGKVFYWNPKFMLKFSPIGIRIIATHEASHANYMHITRKGGRKPKLWNVCVDYMVHKLIMEDFSSRKNVKTSQEYGKDGAAKLFKENLGNYYTVQDFKNLVDNNKTVNDFPAEIKAKIHDILNGNGDEINLPAPDVSSITDEQKKAFEKRDRRKMTFYLDPDIPKELATAEQLYEFFMELHRKASKKFGPGVADAIFQIGDTLDEHFDTDVAEEELSKRLYDAQQFAKSQNAGKSPAGIDGELDRLNEPVLRWQDKVRSTVRRITSGNEKCDYSRFKTKHLLLGIFEPKRRSYKSTFHALCDTSGSMADEDIAFAVSQVAAFKDIASGTLTPADADVYWDHALKLDKCTKENLVKFKVQGRGGTVFRAFFENYEKKLGKADFLVILTDGYLSEMDYVEIAPKIPTFWIITSHNPHFKPPFGKVYHLRNDKL